MKRRRRLFYHIIFNALILYVIPVLYAAENRSPTNVGGRYEDTAAKIAFVVFVLLLLGFYYFYLRRIPTEKQLKKKRKKKKF